MSAPAPQPAPEFRWQAFFQRARDPLFLLNRRRRLLFVNRAWEELTGLPADRVRGLACTRRTPASLAPTDEVTRALCPPHEVLHGHGARVRRCLPAPGGRHCWDVEFLPFRDDDGTLGILGKITVVASGPLAGFFSKPASEPLAATGEPASGPLAAPGEPASGPLAATGPAGAALPEKVVALRAALAGHYDVGSLAEDTPAERRLVEQVRLAAGSRAAVLLVGEPGTGKRWLARVIHGRGAAREQAFAAVDCARLPPEPLAAALFGEGGLARRPGVGTLYLREPAALPRDLQARLVELLADPGPAAPRVLAGTSADVDAEVRSGRLLEELRCALGTLVLEVPPLRRRMADLPRLVERLLAQTATPDEPRTPQLTPAAWECLRGYSWPRNLSELRGALLTARLHAGGEVIDAADLPGYVRLAVQLGQAPGARSERPLPLAPLLAQVERRLIRLALHRAQGNKSRAAELLSLWRPKLLRRMQALGLLEKDEG